MQLEAIGTISVRHFFPEVGGQVDDVDSVEGTFLGTDATADTESFANEGNL